MQTKGQFKAGLTLVDFLLSTHWADLRKSKITPFTILMCEGGSNCSRQVLKDTIHIVTWLENRWCCLQWQNIACFLRNQTTFGQCKGTLNKRGTFIFKHLQKQNDHILGVFKKTTKKSVDLKTHSPEFELEFLLIY